MSTLAGPALWWRLLAIGGLWGASFPLLRAVATEMSPLALATTRGAFAAAAVLAFLAATGQIRGYGRRSLVHGLVLGTTNGWIPNLLTAFALGRIEAAPAALIHAATPLLVALFATLLLRDEHPGRRGLLGLGLGFLGIAVIVGPAAVQGGASLLGGLLILVSGVSYALGTVYARWARPGAPALIALGQQLFAATVAGVFSFAADSPGAYDLPGRSWVILALLGILGSALPLTMFLSLLSRVRATQAAMVGYLQPAFAAAIGAAWLGEWPSLNVQLGGFIVLAGVWLATTKPTGLTPPKPSPGRR